MINKYSKDGTLICSYNSVTEASEDTGVHHSSICQFFTGKKKQREDIYGKEFERRLLLV